jgi:hypothetical protein
MSAISMPPTASADSHTLRGSGSHFVSRSGSRPGSRAGSGYSYGGAVLWARWPRLHARPNVSLGPCIWGGCLHCSSHGPRRCRLRDQERLVGGPARHAVRSHPLGGGGGGAGVRAPARPVSAAWCTAASRDALPSSLYMHVVPAGSRALHCSMIARSSMQAIFLSAAGRTQPPAASAAAAAALPPATCTAAAAAAAAAGAGAAAAAACTAARRSPARRRRSTGTYSGWVGGWVGGWCPALLPAPAPVLSASPQRPYPGAGEHDNAEAALQKGAGTFHARGFRACSLPSTTHGPALFRLSQRPRGGGSSGS